MVVTAWILLVSSVIMIYLLFDTVTKNNKIQFVDAKLMSFWIVIFAIACGVLFGNVSV